MDLLRLLEDWKADLQSTNVDGVAPKEERRVTAMSSLHRNKKTVNMAGAQSNTEEDANKLGWDEQKVLSGGSL